MTLFASYLVVWGEDALTLATQSQIGAFAEAARAHHGVLLAFGPTHDSSEQQSRSVPPWLAVARFVDENAATRWFEEVGDKFRGTTYVIPALPQPPWWPADLEGERPEWSQRLEPPPDRLGLFNCVWTGEITDPAKFLDYSAHFMWTVEQGGGVFLAKAAMPRILGGSPRPQGAALMGWPKDGIARRAWYGGARYRPYKQQRHDSSKSTTSSVMALTSEGRHVERLYDTSRSGPLPH